MSLAREGVAYFLSQSLSRGETAGRVRDFECAVYRCSLRWCCRLWRGKMLYLLATPDKDSCYPRVGWGGGVKKMNE